MAILIQGALWVIPPPHEGRFGGIIFRLADSTRHLFQIRTPVAPSSRG